MREFIPVLLQIIVAIGFAASALIVSVILGQTAKTNRTKDTAYECGMVADTGPQPRFSVKFYLVAMLFILFDIEVVFLFPWAVIYRDFIAEHGSGIFWSMLSFVAVLTVGYIYAIKKGVLNWKG
jgi:NADH-quinone oxidoreductase subunit A